MRTVKLTLACDGTDFRGWQVQPGQPTIQGVLMETLTRITNEAVAVHGAGRTDAGVHARGQVAHFATASRMAPEEFQRALNALMPASIRVMRVEEAAGGFHARHSATGKRYSYRIFRGAVMPPTLARYALHHGGSLDESAMTSAARFFVGEHDFTTFTAPADELDAEGQPQPGPNPVRTVLESEFSRVPPEGAADYDFVYRVRGRSFLRYMVRKMVGTLLEVGRGRLTPEDIPRLLAQRDRAECGPTAPPHGLFLESVEYEA